MRSVGRRPVCILRGRKGCIEARKSDHRREAKDIFRGLPQAGFRPISIDAQSILAYAANAVAILLAAMNANVSAGPSVPPEPG